MKNKIKVLQTGVMTIIAPVNNKQVITVVSPSKNKSNKIKEYWKGKF